MFETASGCLNTSDNYGTVSNLESPIVGMSAVGTYTSAFANARTGGWMVDGDGGMFAMCGAPYFGSMGGTHLNNPILGIAVRYWSTRIQQRLATAHTPCRPVLPGHTRCGASAAGNRPPYRLRRTPALFSIPSS